MVPVDVSPALGLFGSAVSDILDVRRLSGAVDFLIGINYASLFPEVANGTDGTHPTIKPGVMLQNQDTFEKVHGTWKTEFVKTPKRIVKTLRKTTPWNADTDDAEKDLGDIDYSWYEEDSELAVDEQATEQDGADGDPTKLTYAKIDAILSNDRATPEQYNAEVALNLANRILEPTDDNEASEEEATTKKAAKELKDIEASEEVINIKASEEVINIKASEEEGDIPNLDPKRRR